MPLILYLHPEWRMEVFERFSKFWPTVCYALVLQAQSSHILGFWNEVLCSSIPQVFWKQQYWPNATANPVTITIVLKWAFSLMNIFWNLISISLNSQFKLNSFDPVVLCNLIKNEFDTICEIQINGKWVLLDANWD